MNDLKNVLIVGLGAIGSIYAVKLSEYDPDHVFVLTDETRQARYQRDGIRFNGQRYDFNYLTPAEADHPMDLILIATKSHGLDSALDALTPFVHDSSVIISLLNGVSSPAAIAARYGWAGVLYAFFTGHGSTRVGNAITHDGVCTIVFGEADNTIRSAAVQRVTALFDRAGIAYEVPDDMLLALWKKFVLNVGVNQASAVLRASYGDFQRNERALNVAVRLMEEAVAVARAEGIHHPDELLPWSLDFIHHMTPAFKSSMLQDVEAGRATEVDLFGEVVCNLGAKHQIDTPWNAMFVQLIRALEQGFAPDRAS